MCIIEPRKSLQLELESSLDQKKKVSVPINIKSATLLSKQESPYCVISEVLTGKKMDVYYHKGLKMKQS